MKLTIEQRLLARTTENTKGCWVCSYSSMGDGYPVIQIDHRGVRCNRVAYRLWVGPIPDGLLVCHSCDNPQCINPEHLWLGTPKDNSQDMSIKGRGSKVGNKGNVKGDMNGSRLHPEKLARGDNHYFRKHPEKLKRGDDHWARRCPEKLADQRGIKNPGSKLTEEQVQYIRMWGAEGFKHEDIAKAFGMTQTPISAIIRRGSWRHLPEFEVWRRGRETS